jgi:hypothetical protein
MSDPYTEQAETVPTETYAEALDILADQIISEDGVPEMVLRLAAARLRELERLLVRVVHCNDMDHAVDIDEWERTIVEARAIITAPAKEDDA